MPMANSGDTTEAMIMVRDLRRRCGLQQVLNGVNLDCPRGKITTILGPSGCGKTMLLKHLYLLLRPDSGHIIVDGIDVTKLNSRGLDRVREKFGVLFQAGALYDSMTVFENVAFPLVEKTRMSCAEIAEHVHEMLRQVGLEGMENKYPSELSGGMQKRVALAGALIQRPKILMLDEPTTGLDPTRTRSIHQLVRHTQQNLGLTVVMVSHDVRKYSRCQIKLPLCTKARWSSLGACPRLCLRTTKTSSDSLPAKRRARTSCPPFGSRRALEDRIRCTRVEPPGCWSGSSSYWASRRCHI
jgi:phospholipid/cholesterol/gamma-HCH transport system ATP-binding protein